MQGQQDFEEEIDRVVETYLDDFDDYYEMKKIFDKKIAGKALERAQKVKGASRRLGVSYKKWRKMFRGE